MKVIAIYLIAIVISFAGSYQVVKYFDTREDTTILGASDDQDASPAPETTATPRPTKKPTPTPTVFPTPKPTSPPQPRHVSQPKFTDEEINNFINRFAGQYGVDADVLRSIATCESGFNANAVNGSNVGLFQFVESTWKSNRAAMGEETDPNIRFNAEEATQTAAYMLAQGKTSIWPNCAP